MRALSSLLLGLIVIVVVAWLGLWWYAEGRIEDGVNAWATQTASGGQMKVSYDSMTRGSSPLAATVTIHNLHIIASPAGQGTDVTVNIPLVVFNIGAASPTVLTITAGKQLSVAAIKGDVAVTYDEASLVEHLNSQALFSKTTQPVKSTELRAGNINVLASSGSLQIVHIDDIDASAAFDPTATAKETAGTVNEIFQGISLSPIVTRIAGLPFDGKIAEIAFTLDANGPVPASWVALGDKLKAIPTTDLDARRKLLATALHDWAAGGGTGTSTAKLVLGPTTLHASGNVKFDANVQPIAAGDLTANHLDAFTQAIANAYPQVQPQIAQAEAVLSPYLTTNGDDGQVLTLHAATNKGNIEINGKPVAPLPPVDWTSLENPAPVAPAPTAPDPASPVPGASSGAPPTQ